MSFTDPGRLWLLLAVAALAIVYVLVQRRRGTYALRFSDASLLDTVAPKRPGWRRHVVALLFLCVGASMILALAGPTREEEVPRERATVVLTIDTSLSMGADDVEPTRIDGAKEAALAFLDDAPDTVDIGLVSFDGVPVVRALPTDDRDAVAAAVRDLELDQATATGDAIFTSLDAIEAVGVEPSNDDDQPSAVIVLLSDGTPTVPSSALDDDFALRWLDQAVAAAVEAGVPVSTVAFGTADGVVAIEDPDVPGSTEIVPVPVDEPTLEGVAEASGGSFFTTSSADELADVYRDIGTTVGFETTDRDLTDWFVVLALVLAALTSMFSLLWFQRLP